MSDIDGGDVNVRLVHALTDYAALTIGRNASIAITERALASKGVDAAVGSEPHAWVPLDVLRAVADALAVETGADVLARAVRWHVPSRPDLRVMSLTAFATPRAFFANVDRARELFARHVRFSVTVAGGRHARVVLHYREGLPRHAHSCQLARGLLAALPTLFDLPEAAVEQTQCFAEGAPACEYVVAWRNELSPAALGAALGIAIAVLGLLLLPSAWWATAPIVGLLVGREVGMTRRRRAILRASEEQSRVIEGHERELAQRSEDVAAAHTELEARVSQRTSTLERTLHQLREQNAYLRSSLLEMEKLQAELLEAGNNKLLGEAVRELAHEFKNPLTVVSANLKFIEDGTASGVEDLMELTRDMRIGVERMRSVLSWFVDLYRSVPSQLAPRDLATEVRTAVTPLIKRLGAVQLRLEVESARVAAHEGQLGQVAVNLVTNAAQAMDGEGSITVRVFRRDGRAILTVEDQGPGIPEELRQRVFERGFTTKPGGEWRGSGLGLYIARTIVERHAGRISVRSSPSGRGATFEIDLPLLTDERDVSPKRSSDAPSPKPS